MIELGWTLLASYIVVFAILLLVLGPMQRSLLPKSSIPYWFSQLVFAVMAALWPLLLIAIAQSRLKARAAR